MKELNWARRLGAALLAAALGTSLLAACAPGPQPGPAGASDPAAPTPGADTPAAATPAETETVFAVTVVRAAAGELVNYLRVNGDVRNTGTVDVLPDTAGKVTALNVSLGQRVEAGAVLALIDPSRPGLEFVASPVRAPIAGTVVALPVNLGATVAPSLPIVRLSRPGDNVIVTHVAERSIARMRLGLEARLTFEALPGESFRATVSEIAPTVDPLSRTLEVKLRLLRPDDRLKPGMFSQIQLVTERRRNVVKVPGEALVRRFGEIYAYVVTEEGRVARRTVTLGLEIDGKAEITQGLADGDQVVVRGQTLLEDGSKVRVVSEMPPLAQETL